MAFDFNLLTPIILAIACGVIPAMIWLTFWTREDRENPEPKIMIALAFTGGVIAVFLSLFLEKYFYGLGLKNIIATNFSGHLLPWFKATAEQYKMQLDNLLLVVIFAPLIEELTKFIFAYILVLRSRDNDEPLDPMIYMITTALGFAAIENTLFLLSPIEKNNVILTIFTGNMRFIGATLLHTISSATIGLFMSFSFFSFKIRKTFFALIGVLCAIAIHSTFNFLMVGNQSASLMALELIWVAVIIVLLAFEKIKKIKREKID